MSSLSQALSETIPYLYPAPDLDPKGLAEKVDRIQKITKDLDGLDHGMKTPDADPALKYIARLLRQDIERAQMSLKEGHTEYAKGVLRNSVSYCIACHTRAKEGVEFPLLKSFDEPLRRASWVERIEFQAASRQFDTVLSEVKGKLSGTGAPGINALDLERGTRLALAIYVRVKQDPNGAASLAQAMGTSKHASFTMKEASKAWTKDIREWQKDRASYKTDADLMKAARALMAPDGEPRLGGHREVRHLRASLLMHELMRKSPNSPHIAEALYIEGRAYDSLRELGLWSLHETYFLACIEKAPGTEISARCYREYEESVTLGYSGSSGVHVPAAVRQHLEQVKKKAIR